MPQRRTKRCSPCRDRIPRRQASARGCAHARERSLRASSGVKTIIRRSLRRPARAARSLRRPSPRHTPTDRAARGPPRRRAFPTPYAFAFTIGMSAAPGAGLQRAPRSARSRPCSPRARRRLGGRYISRSSTAVKHNVRAAASRPGLDETLALMRDLRKRCDWDAAQTHESLRPYLIEEAHELDEAIRDGDDRAHARGAGRRSASGSVPFGARGGAWRFRLSRRGGAGSLRRCEAAIRIYTATARSEPWEKMKSKKRVSLADGLAGSAPVVCIERNGFRIAPPASASTGRIGAGRRRRSTRSCAKSTALLEAHRRLPCRRAAVARRRPRAPRVRARRSALRVRESLPQGGCSSGARARCGEREVSATRSRHRAIARERGRELGGSVARAARRDLGRSQGAESSI